MMGIAPCYQTLFDQRQVILYLIVMFSFVIFVKAAIPPGRDPRAVETRGPVAGQRVPVAGGMQGAPSHAMPSNAPQSARPVCLTPILYFIYWWIKYSEKTLFVDNNVITSTGSCI